MVILAALEWPYPSLVGAVQETVACVVPSVYATDTAVGGVGAEATAAGVTVSGALYGEFPTPLVAATFTS